MTTMDTVPVRQGVFTENVAVPRLLAARCRDCGQTVFPAARSCPVCPGSDLARVELGPHGTLFCTTTVYMKSANFAAPYSVGYVDLPGGVRLFTQLRVEPGADLPVGTPMTMEIVPLWQENGAHVLGYRFFPTGDHDGGTTTA